MRILSSAPWQEGGAGKQKEHGCTLSITTSPPGDADGTLMSHFLPAQGRGAVPARCCSNWSESNPPTPWNMVLRTRTHAKPPTNITGHRCSPSKESEARLHECEAWSGEVICVFESAPMCVTDENLEMGRPRLDAAFS